MRGGSVHALHAAHLQFLRRRLRRHIVVEDARFGFLDMLIDGDADDDVLVTAIRAAEADAVALADDTMGLRMFGVDFDLAALTRAFGFRTCLEQTGDIQPHVEPNALGHSDKNFDLRLRFQRLNEHLGLRVAILLRQIFLDLFLRFIERYDA